MGGAQHQHDLEKGEPETTPRPIGRNTRDRQPDGGDDQAGGGIDRHLALSGRRR